MRNKLLFLLLITSTSIYAIQSKQYSTLNVREMGAKGDGVVLETKIIQQAIDICSQSGGTVYFPPGVYSTGSLELKDNVELNISNGAVILGSTNLLDYKEYIPALKSYNDLFLKYSLFYAEGKSNITIRGGGIIDGQGAAFKVTTKIKPDRYKNRPFLIRFVQCKNIRVENLTLQNSAMWMQHYLACEDLFIHQLKIYNHANQNNDMIDIDGCKNVVMSDCIGDTEDDAITLKSTSPYITENITISNCVVSSHCNAIKTGTESTGGFKNINISDIVIKPSANRNNIVGYPDGISGISLTNVDGGVLDGITISNIRMDGPQVPIYLRLAKRGRKYTEDAAEPGVGVFKNVSISNISAINVGSTGCSITGMKDVKVENIIFENINISFAGGGTVKEADKLIPEDENEYPESTRWGLLPAYGFFIRHADNITFNNVNLSFAEQDQRSAVVLDDVNNFCVRGLKATSSPLTSSLIKVKDSQNISIFSSQSMNPVDSFISIEGDLSKSISLIGNNLIQVKKPFVSKIDSIVFLEGNLLGK